jgi:hypothetical protein
MELKAGQALVSVTDTTSVIVVAAPPGDVEVTCGGLPMVEKSAAPAEPSPIDPAHADGTLLGKRYADPSGALELLCTKGGPASLALAGVPLGQKEAKALPSSD